MTLQYKIKYSRRRTLAICVKKDANIIIYSPMRLSIKRIEGFIEDKKVWLENTVLKVKTRIKISNNFEKWKKIKYLGGIFILNFVDEDFDNLKFEWNSILISSKNKLEAQDILKKWYMNNAFNILNERVIKYARIMELTYNKLKLSNASWSWWTCTSKKNLLFNWRLLQYEEKIIDYVIVHELSHLIEPNHSQKFWNIVIKYCPNYKELRKILKEKENNIF